VVGGDEGADHQGAHGDRGARDGHGQEHGDQDRADDQDHGGAAADEGERGARGELDDRPGRRRRGDRGTCAAEVTVVGSMTAGGVTTPVGWGMVGIFGRNMSGSPFAVT
jgi:hypothetical protein